ncbi:MAG: cell division protein FtsZ [Ignavibacteriaceae bacterium]|nr:cell division protein FtsZ [Ignavibacteriaceae bacterium]
MSHFATLDRGKSMSAVLKVVGVGGGGCNAIESMIKRGLQGVEYVSINTDAQVLRSSNAAHKIQVGTNITRGLGAGADPNVGKKSVEEDREKISEVLAGSDMVFVTAGMGGGTGTGGAPIIASIAKSIGSLVVGIVTKPFKWEGKKRMLNAEQGIQELKQYVDSLIVIPNERLLSILDKSTNAFAAFDKPNEVLYEATRGIADIITVEGLINVDFADVRAVMNQSGEALMGCGVASGENRAIEAAQKAISSPLLEGINIKGAKSVLLNVTGSSSLTIQEVNEGNNIIFEAAGEEANVIFGCVQKEEMNDYVSYTVIATGFDGQSRSFSSKTYKSTKSKQKEPDVFAGRFNFGTEPAEVDTTNLEIPTYLRIKKPQSQLELDRNDEDDINSGFVFNTNKLNWSKEKVIKEAEQKTNDEDDSSSFLRMIMD